jgi:hypothetical protein
MSAVASSSLVQFDTEVSKKMGWWDEKLRREGQKLCKEHSFTTGFLEGGGSHSLVDSYELKVRLRYGVESCLIGKCLQSLQTRCYRLFSVIVVERALSSTSKLSILRFLPLMFGDVER